MAFSATPKIDASCCVAIDATSIGDVEVGSKLDAVARSRHSCRLVAAVAVLTPRTFVPPYSFVTGVPGDVHEQTEEQRSRRRPRPAEGGDAQAQPGGYSSLAAEYLALGYGERLGEL